MSKQYDKEFKEDAVKYYKDHDELNIKKCSENLGIAADGKKRRLNVSGVLRILGVSRNGYYSFKKRKTSQRQLHKGILQDEIINKPFNYTFG